MAEAAILDEALAIARRILDNEIDPYRGAAAIWARMAEREGGYAEPLAVFVGLASEWQDDPEHRSALEDDIREEARRLVDKALDDE
jgi:hypothetical protein